MSTALNISILYIGAVRMGCLLFFFLSCKTSTRANINPMCTISRFNTSLEKNACIQSFIFCCHCCFVFFSFLWFLKELPKHPTMDSSKSQRGGSCVFALSRTLSMLKTHKICHWHLFLWCYRRFFSSALETSTTETKIF